MATLKKGEKTRRPNREKEIEKELRLSKALFKIVTDSSPMAIYLAEGVNQRGIYLNPRFTELFGYTLDDIPSVKHWYPLAYPDPKYRSGLVKEWRKRVREATKTGKPIKPMEAVATCKDGSKKIIVWNFVSVGKQNISYGMDLTESKNMESALKESRQKYKSQMLRLKAILDSTPAIIWIANDPQGVEVIGNKAAYEFLEEEDSLDISKAGSESKTFRHFNVYENGKKLKGHQIPIQRVSATGQPLYDHELEFVFGNGTKKTIIGNVIPITDDNNLPAGAVAAFIDITDRKQLEERKENFINMASHELKTPLTILKIYLEVISKRLKENDIGKVNNILLRTDTQIDKLNGLVMEMLDAAKMQSRKIIFKKELFDLDKLIKDIIEDMVVAVNSDTKRPYSFVYKNQEKIMVTGDSFRISQVLNNLLTNAVKFSSSSRMIKIKIKKEMKNVIVGIQDFGIGIPKEKQKHLFKRFYQIEEKKYTQHKFTSLGLGLYISERIIRSHKGKMWVKSEENKGSTFYFSLPVK